MDRRLNHFLLKGGRLLDPANSRDGSFDIRVRGGVVEDIAQGVAADGATVIDVSSLLVTPGLIDVHLHLMNGLGAFGADRCTRFEQTGSMRRRQWTGHEDCREQSPPRTSRGRTEQ